MKILNLIWDNNKLNVNREEICQSCEAWICIQNCRQCLFNALSDYNPKKSQYVEWVEFWYDNKLQK